MDDQIIGRRIREEREKKGLSQQKLAELAGIVHRQTLGGIEDGKRKLQAVELFGISKALGLRPDYLLSEQQTVGSQPLYLWRNLNSEAKVEWEGKFSAHISNFNLIEQVLALPGSQCIDLPKKILDIESAKHDEVYSLAEQVREQLDLGSFPSLNLEAVLEEKYGVRIFYVDLHDRGSAATTRTTAPVIFLNRYEAPWRRTYSLAHELFHLVTWSDDLVMRAQSEDQFHDKNEKLADTFAAGLLMPSEILTAELKKLIRDGRLTYADIVSLSRTFAVSSVALLYRLVNLRFITFEQANQIKDDSSFKELDKQDQKFRWHTPAFLSEKFIKLAYQAYQASKISKARFAEMLEVPLIDVDDVLADRGLVEIEDNEVQINIT